MKIYCNNCKWFDFMYNYATNEYDECLNNNNMIKHIEKENHEHPEYTWKKKGKPYILNKNNVCKNKKKKRWWNF